MILLRFSMAFGGPMSKKVLVAFLPEMLKQIDFCAAEEHRTRSDLIREGMRRYLDNFKRGRVAPVSTPAPAPFPAIQRDESISLVPTETHSQGLTG